MPAASIVRVIVIHGAFGTAVQTTSRDSALTVTCPRPPSAGSCASEGSRMASSGVNPCGYCTIFATFRPRFTSPVRLLPVVFSANAIFTGVDVAPPEPDEGVNVSQSVLDVICHGQPVAAETEIVKDPAVGGTVNCPKLAAT